MRRLGILLLLIISVASASIATAQDVYDLHVGGVKVIVQPTKANQVIAITVALQGGFAIGETENPLLPVATAAVTTTSGSAHYPKEQYREILTRLVTSISSNADHYYTKYTLNCVRPKFDESWRIFEDVIKEPLYDQTEFSNFQDQVRNDIASRKSSPEGWNYFVLDSLWTAGHRAGRVVEPADVNDLTIGAMRTFHDKILERSRMTVVIVGDVTRGEVERKIGELLDQPPAIPAGMYAARPYDKIGGPGVSTVTSEARPLPTTYIAGRLAGPERGDADYWPLKIASSILSDRLYEEVRTKRNLSYAPYANFGGMEGEYMMDIGVSTTKPDSTMHVVRRELDNMRENGVTVKELRDMKESFLTQVYMSQQSNLAAASRLLVTELETGDYHNALRMPEFIRNVSLSQIRNAVGKYFHTILWTTVGETSHLSKDGFLYP